MTGKTKRRASDTVDIRTGLSADALRQALAVYPEADVGSSHAQAWTGAPAPRLPTSSVSRRRYALRWH